MSDNNPYDLPDYKSLSEIHAFCIDNNLTFQIESYRNNIAVTIGQYYWDPADLDIILFELPERFKK